jgi:hypothetical protein
VFGERFEKCAVALADGKALIAKRGGVHRVVVSLAMREIYVPRVRREWDDDSDEDGRRRRCKK